MFDLKTSAIVFINLPDRPERYNHMLKQLAGGGANIKKIDGIRYRGDFNDLDYKIPERLEGQKGYIGIFLAHLNALRWMKNNLDENCTNIALLEDDVIISDDFWEDNFIDQVTLPADWEILLLSPRYRINKNFSGNKSNESISLLDNGSFKEGRAVNIGLVRGKYICTGAHFVVFRDLAVVKKVFSRLKNSEYIYDVDGFYINEFNIYGINSPYIKAGGFESDHNT